ncbi:MAG: hypothetical protein HXP18_01290 [Veillonella sp.]|nr:hypothetical protein [Veillonella sp.]
MMAYIVSTIAYACLLFLLVAYAVWDGLVLLLFALRALIEVCVLVVSVLLASTDVSLRRMSNTSDPTVWGVAKYEYHKMVDILRRDLLATLMTPKLISEMTR